MSSSLSVVELCTTIYSTFSFCNQLVKICIKEKKKIITIEKTVTWIIQPLKKHHRTKPAGASKAFKKASVQAALS